MIVLIHGFSQSNFAMWMVATRLVDSRYKVNRIGYNSFTQDMNVILEEAKKLNNLVVTLNNKK